MQLAHSVNFWPVHRQTKEHVGRIMVRRKVDWKWSIEEGTPQRAVASEAWSRHGKRQASLRDTGIRGRTNTSCRYRWVPGAM